MKEPTEATGRVRHPTDRDLTMEAPFDARLLHVRHAFDGRRERFQPGQQIALGAPVEDRRQIGRPGEREEDDHAHGDGGRQIRVHVRLHLLGNRISRQRYRISGKSRPSPDFNAVAASDPYNVRRSGTEKERKAGIEVKRLPGRRRLHARVPVAWDLGLGRELGYVFWAMIGVEAAFGSYVGIWPLWIEALGAPITVVGLVLGSAGLLRLLTLAPSAVLADRIDPRTLIVAARSMTALGMISAAFATHW